MNNANILLFYEIFFINLPLFVFCISRLTYFIEITKAGQLIRST